MTDQEIIQRALERLRGHWFDTVALTYDGAASVTDEWTIAKSLAALIRSSDPTNPDLLALCRAIADVP